MRETAESEDAGEDEGEDDVEDGEVETEAVHQYDFTSMIMTLRPNLTNSNASNEALGIMVRSMDLQVRLKRKAGDE